MRISSEAIPGLQVAEPASTQTCAGENIGGGSDFLTILNDLAAKIWPEESAPLTEMTSLQSDDAFAGQDFAAIVADMEQSATQAPEIARYPVVAPGAGSGTAQVIGTAEPEDTPGQIGSNEAEGGDNPLADFVLLVNTHTTVTPAAPPVTVPNATAPIQPEAVVTLSATPAPSFPVVQTAPTQLAPDNLTRPAISSTDRLTPIFPQFDSEPTAPDSVPPNTESPILPRPSVPVSAKTDGRVDEAFDDLRIFGATNAPVGQFQKAVQRGTISPLPAMVQGDLHFEASTSGTPPPTPVPITVEPVVLRTVGVVLQQPAPEEAPQLPVPSEIAAKPSIPAGVAGVSPSHEAVDARSMSPVVSDPTVVTTEAPVTPAAGAERPVQGEATRTSRGKIPEQWNETLSSATAGSSPKLQVKDAVIEAKPVEAPQTGDTDKKTGQIVHNVDGVREAAEVGAGKKPASRDDRVGAGASSTILRETQRPETVRPSESTATRPPEFLQQLADRIRLLPQSETGEIRIQLKPEFLGNLEIKAENGANGLIARIAAASESVKTFLDGNLHVLHQSLQEQGLKVDRIDVVINGALDSRQSTNQQQFSGQSHGGSGKSETQAPGAPIRSGSGRDYLTVDAKTILALGPNSTFHTVA